MREVQEINGKTNKHVGHHKTDAKWLGKKLIFCGDDWRTEISHFFRISA